MDYLESKKIVSNYFESKMALYCLFKINVCIDDPILYVPILDFTCEEWFLHCDMSEIYFNDKSHEICEFDDNPSFNCEDLIMIGIKDDEKIMDSVVYFGIFSHSKSIV